MKCVVATLFEHHYHVGAAALANSLVRAGFTGTIYAGFRGPLPAWARDAKKTRENEWTLAVTPDVRLIFLELETRAHFTNHKPDFLLRIEKLATAESDALVYCDPDLVLTGRWSFVEDWLSCGVALCEDVNSPLARNHPWREGWRRFFAPLGFELRFRDPEYANGGFVGLRWEHRKLLVTWQALLGHALAALGGDDVVGIEGGRRLAAYGFADCFLRTDQDALNAALEACPEIPLSFLGRAAMGFAAGEPRLPHALGQAKPWLRNYVREALQGRPPSQADKAFWQHADGPLRPYSPSEISGQRFQLAIGAALGRFINRK